MRRRKRTTAAAKALRTKAAVHGFVASIFRERALPMPHVYFRPANGNALAFYNNVDCAITICGLPASKSTVAHEVEHALRDWADKLERYMEELTSASGNALARRHARVRR